MGGSVKISYGGVLFGRWVKGGRYDSTTAARGEAGGCRHSGINRGQSAKSTQALPALQGATIAAAATCAGCLA